MMNAAAMMPVCHRRRCSVQSGAAALSARSGVPGWGAPRVLEGAAERRLWGQRLWLHPWRQLCLLLSLLPFCLLLASCDGEPRAEGVTWQAPPEDSMERGFTEEDGVPYYALTWRMPPGFRGFVQRWNARASDFLRRASEKRWMQLAMMKLEPLLCPAPKAKRRHAAVQARQLREELRELEQRRKMGDYLVFYPERQLPKSLVWQDGAGEPELGSPKARKGGVMRLAIQRSFPTTLRAFGPNSNNTTRRYICDDLDIPLVRLHPATGHLIPGTADRWAVSPDGRTVYFHIDEAARFSNGSPLTTRDFITSLYVRTSEFSMEPFYRDFYLSSFARIAVYGDHVLAVTLASARPLAPYYAAVPACCTSFFAEFGPDYPTRYQWRPMPTTGGYRVEPEGLVMGRQIVLERVRDWWAAERRYTRYSCNVDHIVYSFIVEPSKLRELFRIGELDVCQVREPDVWYEGLEIEPVHRGYIQRVHFNNIWPRNCLGIYLNGSHPRLRSRELRKGVQYALNIQEVIETVFRGDYSRSGSFFAGFGPYTDESIEALPYSPEEARACFAKAGYVHEGADGILYNDQGERLQLVISSRVDPLFSTCMSLLREEAARCGLELKFETLDDTVFYTKVMNKQVQASLFSWNFSPPLPNPAPFFFSAYAYGPDGSVVRGTANITATSSPALDSAILDTFKARTEHEAIAAHHRVQRLIAGTYSWVPGWYSSFARFAQWRWVCWPDEPNCRFCPPRYYDPLDSHLYWIDEQRREETLRARAAGESFPEVFYDIALPRGSEETEP